jgi:hypothetical protein
LGFVQNTCAFWRVSHFAQTDDFTSDRGVEEVSVLCALRRKGYTSVILKTADAVLSVRPEDKKRRAELVRTKWERIQAELARSGATWRDVQSFRAYAVNL